MTMSDSQCDILNVFRFTVSLTSSRFTAEAKNSICCQIMIPSEEHRRKSCAIQHLKLHITACATSTSWASAFDVNLIYYWQEQKTGKRMDKCSALAKTTLLVPLHAKSNIYFLNTCSRLTVNDSTVQKKSLHSHSTKASNSLCLRNNFAF